ncbi:MAG: hypothetical protein QOD80_2008, partial [Verrucomicrobiota bacterium]
MFEILQGGFHTPLTTTQVAGLFQAGCLSPGTGTNEYRETERQTIDDLLPLLRYRTSRLVTRRLAVARRSRPFCLSLATAIPLAVLGVAATVVIGCFFFSPRSSMASP